MKIIRLILMLLLGFALLSWNGCMCGGEDAGTEDDDTQDDDAQDDDTDNVPEAPSNLTAEATGSTTILLNWVDTANNENGFVIERSLNGVDFTEIAKLEAENEETYLDTGLVPDTKYFYRIKAYNEFGESDYSNIASATTLEWEGFSEPVFYSVHSGPIFVGLADFNKDDSLDIVVAYYGFEGISILLNDGSGTFGPKSDYSIGAFADAPIGLGDFDRDSDIDFAISASNKKVVILFNNGNGTFGSPIAYDVSEETCGKGLAVGDLDNEDGADLVVPLCLSKLAIFMNEGDGTFSLPTYYESFPASFVTIGQLNSVDGYDYPDLVVSEGWTGDKKTLSIYINRGDGTFYPKVSYSTSHTVERSALDTLDDNESLDIAVACNGYVDIFLNNGDGTFIKKGSYFSGAVTTVVATGDFDGDKYTDIVAGNDEQIPWGSISILKNLGDASFDLVLVYPLNMPHHVATGDIDNDGDIDVVATATADADIAVFFNLLIP